MHKHTGLLESFHNLVLLREFFTSEFCLLDIYWSYAYYFYNKNQGYKVHVKLAVLDHNAHLQRGHVTNAKGEKIYHQKYGKQTKKWDATPVMENKKYEYIPGKCSFDVSPNDVHLTFQECLSRGSSFATISYHCPHCS